MSATHLDFGMSHTGPVYKYVNPDGPEAASSEASFGTDEEKRLAQEESRRTASPAADVESPEAADRVQSAEPAGEIQAAAEVAGGPAAAAAAAAAAPAAAPQSPFAMVPPPVSPPDAASVAEPESQAVEEAYMRGGMAAVRTSCWNPGPSCHLCSPIPDYPIFLGRCS